MASRTFSRTVAGKRTAAPSAPRARPGGAPPATRSSRTAAPAALPVGSAPAPALRFYEPQTYQPEESVGYLMRRILAAVSLEVERELEPSGLTNAQWIPLLKLYMGTAGAVAELARECQLDAGAMTRTLDRLESKSLVRRVRSSEDRRVVNLELTDEGRAAAKKIPAVLCGVQNAHLQGFTQEEWQTFKSMLGRILNNAQALQSAKDAHVK